MKKTIKLNNQNVTINILHQNEKFMHFSFEGKEYVFDLVTKKNDHMTISFQQSAHQIVYHQEGFVVDGVEVSVELPQRTRSKDKVKAIICLGTENQKIKDTFNGVVETIVEAGSAMEAVSYGYRLAKKEETVLLSPACASFDLFENYEDRGNQFKSAVRAL